MATWDDDIVPLIDTWLDRENTDVDTITDAVCMAIATAGVRRVTATVARVLTDVLDSGDLTVSDGTITLPTGTRKVLQVYIDEHPLGKPKSREYFDEFYPEWQDMSTGAYPDDYFIEGQTIYFYPPISNDTYVKIVRETDYPAFSSGEGDPNPLDYWPAEHYNYIADWVLEHLPVNSEHTQEVTRVQTARARRQEAEPALKRALLRMRL